MARKHNNRNIERRHHPLPEVQPMRCNRGKEIPIQERKVPHMIHGPGNTYNRALWPRGKATDLKSVLVAEADSKSVEASGCRFESYRCHFLSPPGPVLGE